MVLRHRLTIWSSAASEASPRQRRVRPHLLGRSKCSKSGKVVDGISCFSCAAAKDAPTLTQKGPCASAKAPMESNAKPVTGSVLRDAERASPPRLRRPAQRGRSSRRAIHRRHAPLWHAWRGLCRGRVRSPEGTRRS